MDYYIGIDSGGTKTESILMSEDGSIVRRNIAGGCNPLDVGAAATQKIIMQSIRDLTAEFSGKIVSIYAGIAGGNHIWLPLEEPLEKEFPNAKIRIEDDRRIAVSGTLGHQNGCGMICGTGSSLSIILDGQPIRQVGGLGYLIDTGGSGYEIGRAGLKQVFRFLDGRGPYTVLLELVTNAMGKNPWEGLAEIYAGGRPFIASLAHTVFEGMQTGDEICRKIIDEGAFKLAELTLAAEKYFDGDFSVIMNGGIFKAYPEYAELVKKKSSVHAVMTMASVPPVYGALTESMWQNGKTADARIRQNFMQSYH